MHLRIHPRLIQLVRRGTLRFLVEERTKTITTAELKSYSSDVMDMIRNADQYQLYEMPFQDAERTVVFRKVNNKIAILYDPECNVTGVAPIGKDYQEVKAFICEVDQAIQMQYSCEMKITESAIYESDENQHLDSNALDLSTEEMER